MTTAYTVALSSAWWEQGGLGGSSQVCVTLVHSWGLIPQVVPVHSPSRKDIMEGVKKTLSHFRVVATGSGCALVQLQPLTGGSGAPARLDKLYLVGEAGNGRKVVVSVAAWEVCDGLQGCM